MKYFSLFALCVAVSTNAFSAVPPSRSLRPDTSAVVEEALKVTAAHGIDSPEAKVAWDIVEEMDASDNSQATGGSLDHECDPLDEELNSECKDFGRFLDELYRLRSVITHKDENKKASLAQTLKAIKLRKPEAATAPSSTALTEALEAAKAATSTHGVTSTEARLAWETYEEVAASGLDNAIGVSMEDECHIESGQEACQAIEEMDRVMAVLFALSD